MNDEALIMRSLKRLGLRQVVLFELSRFVHVPEICKNRITRMQLWILI